MTRYRLPPCSAPPFNLAPLGGEFAVRWQCTCGRFIAGSAVHSENIVDPGAYYGVVSRIWANCSRCGEVESPRLVVVGEVAR